VTVKRPFTPEEHNRIDAAIAGFERDTATDLCVVMICGSDRCAWAESGTRARWVSLILLLLILASPALAAEPKFPPLTGRVVDDAGVLNALTRSELTDMLAEHQRATGQQVVVVTLDSLQGFSIEDFGYQLGRHWGIGQKGKNNGALLIVAPKEHKVRIEVGYGLEGTLTDATSRTIIETDILPSFKRGDFNAGILAGATSILKVLSANEGVETSAESNERIDGNDLALDWMILIALALWIVLVIILDHLGSRNQIIRRMGRIVGPGTNYGGGFGGGGFGGGGGGFSGGGGSFGGGGASGSW